MTKSSDRETRLAEALRANLKRRKGRGEAAGAEGAALPEDASESNIPGAPAPRPNPAPKRT